MRLEKSRGGMHHMDGRLTAQKKSTLKQKLANVYHRIAAPNETRTATLTPVAVDYPKSGERVVSREYTIRISAGAPENVEVSVDDEAWLPCRQAAGFWWHDWSDYRAGPHTVLARVSHHKGRRLLSARRDFVVEFV